MYVVLENNLYPIEMTLTDEVGERVQSTEQSIDKYVITSILFYASILVKPLQFQKMAYCLADLVSFSFIGILVSEVNILQKMWRFSFARINN